MPSFTALCQRHHRMTSVLKKIYATHLSFSCSVTECLYKMLPNFLQMLPKCRQCSFYSKTDIFQNSPSYHQLFGLVWRENKSLRPFKKYPNMVTMFSPIIFRAMMVLSSLLSNLINWVRRSLRGHRHHHHIYHIDFIIICMHLSRIKRMR